MVTTLGHLGLKSGGSGPTSHFIKLTVPYSESTSSNPGNLTSATVCGDRTGCAPATKRLAGVAPEVDLRECTLHSPPQKANKAEPTLALNPRGDVTRNPKQGYQWPQKRMCVRQKLFKKTPKTYGSVYRSDTPMFTVQSTGRHVLILLSGYMNNGTMTPQKFAADFKSVEQG